MFSKPAIAPWTAPESPFPVIDDFVGISGFSVVFVILFNGLPVLEDFSFISFPESFIFSLSLSLYLSCQNGLQKLTKKRLYVTRPLCINYPSELPQMARRFEELRSSVQRILH